MENFLDQLRGASYALVGPSLDFQKLSLEVAEEIVGSLRREDGLFADDVFQTLSPEEAAQRVAAAIRRPARFFPFGSPPDMESLLNEIQGLSRGAKTPVMMDELSPEDSTRLCLTPNNVTRDQRYLQVQGNVTSTHGIQLSVKVDTLGVVTTVAFCLHLLDPKKAIDHALALVISLRTYTNDPWHKLHLGAYSILGDPPRSVREASLYFSEDTRQFVFSESFFKGPSSKNELVVDHEGEEEDYDPQAKNYALETIREVYQQLSKYLRTLLP